MSSYPHPPDFYNRKTEEKAARYSSGFELPMAKITERFRFFAALNDKDAKKFASSLVHVSDTFQIWFNSY